MPLCSAVYTLSIYRHFIHIETVNYVYVYIYIYIKKTKHVTQFCVNYSGNLSANNALNSWPFYTFDGVISCTNQIAACVIVQAIYEGLRTRVV